MPLFRPIPSGTYGWDKILNDHLVENGLEVAEAASDISTLQDQIIALTERIEQLEDEFYEHEHSSKE